MDIKQLREKYPQYSDISDGDLLMGFHKKFYPDMHVKDFIDGFNTDPVALRNTMSDKQFDYYSKQVSKKRKGETAEQARERAAGKTSTSDVGFIEGVARAALQGLPFGFSDEIVAAGRAALEPLVRDTDTTFQERYRAAKAEENEKLNAFQRSNPISSTAANLTGSVVGLAPAIAAAPAAFGAGSGSLLARSVAAGSTGAAIGGADAGFRHGFDKERVVSGAATGGVLGAAGPSIGMGVGRLWSAATGLLGRGNEARAADAVAKIVQRSGKMPQQVAQDLKQGVQDGQPFAIADSLGAAGQRALAGITRQPGKDRQSLIQFLLDRQSGQGDRLVNALTEGLDAPNTATQTRNLLKQKRRDEMDTAMDAVRQNAGPVNTAPVIQTIDDIIAPGMGQPISKATGMTADGIEKTLLGVRDRLTDGKSSLSDFNRAYLARQDVADQAFEKQGTHLGKRLRSVRNSFDDALSQASEGFRDANANFARRSRAIDAIDTGAASTSGRTRSSDNIARFNALTPEEQAAFKTGVADSLIARIENTSSSPTTNKARSLLTPKLTSELTAFAGPKGAQLNRRINREQTQFATANAALGGSKTADNLADMADSYSPDPGILISAMQGNFGTAAGQALRQMGRTLDGQNEATRGIVGQRLIETDPEIAHVILETALKSAAKRRRLLTSGVQGLSIPLGVNAANRN